MKIQFQVAPKENSAQTLVVFTYKGSEQKVSKNEKKETEKKAKPVFGKVSDAVKNLASTSGDVTGAYKESVFFRSANLDGFKDVMYVGLGDKSKTDAESLRQIAAEIVKALTGHKSKSGAISLASLIYKGKKDEAAQALTEGFVLSSYSFDTFKSEKNKAGPKKPEHILLIGEKAGDKKFIETGIHNGEMVGTAINFARVLGDTPGSSMTPSILADTAKDELSKHKVKVTIWNKAKIKQEKMGGLYGVSLGSVEEPRFIIMEYNGGGKGKKTIALVGKGLTFDSGGISIKPSANMEEMKYDMCGGANVIGTMLAAAKLKLKVNLIGLVPSSENMPGENANKPGDIFKARNGISVEVNNTDAEGRLILADALVYACEQKPTAIFDMATLTGAMSIALGNLHTGFYTRHRELVKKINEAANASGERVWNMPLIDEHLSDMKGTYADLSNISSGKGAGSATAAAFLGEFVDKDIPWAHFDIAGTAYHTGDRLPYNPKKGASGCMIRTMLELVQSF
jgi:leucyl aminopeptidase